MRGLEVFVFSRTLPAQSRKGVHIVSDDPRDVVAALKAKPGRDIWLFGGGVLCRSLLDAGLVTRSRCRDAGAPRIWCPACISRGDDKAGAD
jgi:dihydrofolate reductase